MAADLILNGKFLSVPMTGVHRVAHELANGLADLAAKGEFGGAEIWHPHDGAERAKAIRLPSRTIGPLRGIAWEQLTLPVAARGRTLLNFCNIAPIAATDAITMIHDAQVHITPQSYGAGFGAWYRFSQPIIASRHRHLLTVSEYSKEQLVNAGLGTPEKISVVHNGVDHILAEAADARILERLGLSKHGYAVALASTQVHKNIRLLLRAFASPRLADLKLVLIGGSDRAEFERIGPISANVQFSGRISDAELRGLYEHALCLAFPSTTEGFGLPPLEAMRVGCPAIVSPCGALPEVCSDAALYAPPHSVEA
jgi:glycosyltransferase involved in cell wall biosynthesis